MTTYTSPPSQAPSALPPTGLRVRRAATCALGALVLALAGCGGGGSGGHGSDGASGSGGGGSSTGSSSNGGGQLPVTSSPVKLAEVQTYWVGGTVSGLAGHGLVLQNNAGDDIAMEADGKFRFASAMASGANYAIAVKTQPAGPAQTCSVSKGSGKVVNAAIDDVAVVCSTDSHSVSGSVTGLLGSGLVLTNNTEDLAVTAGGAITFTEPVANGGDYTVTVKTQPSGPAQTCTESNEHGTGTGSGVNNISVVCTTNSYKVSLALTGLDGVGLVLQNNSGDDIAPTANGNYTFAQEVASGQPYSVTVKTQPTLVTQVCAVSNGSGTIGALRFPDNNRQRFHRQDPAVHHRPGLGRARCDGCAIRCQLRRAAELDGSGCGRHACLRCHT